jgi:hypothetical protein
MKTWLAAALLGLVSLQPASSSLRGTWSASVGAARTLQGTWSAAVDNRTPNAATGSWTLMNGSNQVIAEGTWSAVKTPRTWSGSWSARILPSGRKGGGAIRSGSWRADTPASGGASTFSELLQSTLEKEITGAWRSAGLQGRWWLKGSS